MTMKERILAMVSQSTEVKILETDHTSALFLVTIKDKFGKRRHRGIFYPKEWSPHRKHDDFELENEEYVTPEEEGV